jgi:GT2 family glycosyltransferase
LKPDWDELLFLARDLLTGAGLFKASAMADIGGGLAETPISSQAIARAVIAMASRDDGRPAPVHIPLILSHRKPGATFMSTDERGAALETTWPEPLAVEAIAGMPDALRPRFAASKLPKVSVLIPTRNRHELLRVCLQGLTQVEYGGELETIVIDNDSDDPETIEFLDQLKRDGITVIGHPGPFNFSAMNNHAARIATGDLLCLLNNDIEMRDAAWLESMACHAMRPGVGAVGALLQYPDGTVQHAGVSIGTGDAAGHVYRGIPVADTGHRDMHRLSRSVSAVTAACMMVRREVFMEVGGLDEDAFRVAFNDVDFCLKLRAKGYRNIFAGEAHLTHHESKSRGCDFADVNRTRYLGELERLQDKWGTKTYVDPYHHPLAMRSSEKFVLSP